MGKYPGIFEVLTDRNKVLCKLTKHELALTTKALQSYIDGKRFQMLLKKVKKPEVVLKIDNKYKEFFIPSKKSSSRLFCTLTKKEINKLPHEIEKYITGYKFMKAVHKRKEKEAEPEKDLGDKDETIDDNEEEIEIPSFVMSSDEEGDDEELGDGEEQLDDDEEDCTIEECEPNVESNEKEIALNEVSIPNGEKEDIADEKEETGGKRKLK